MEPITISIGAGVFAIVSAIGTGITVYYKLKMSFDTDLDDAIEKRVKESEAKNELRMQAIEIKHSALASVSVKKEDLATVSANIAHLTTLVEDLKRMIQNNNN